jgi:putative acetyltransferase
MKIIIRHSEKTDIAAIKNIYGQPDNYSGTLQLPYPSFDKWETKLKNIPENFHSLVAVVENKVIGQLGMEVLTHPRRKHVANIGMAVNELFKGKGAGTKLLEMAIDMAQNWVAVKRIELEVYTDNKSAIGLYKKHGFVMEGTAKNYAFRNGTYVDVFLMAKLL